VQGCDLTSRPFCLITPKDPEFPAASEGITLWEIALSEIHLSIRPLTGPSHRVFGAGTCRPCRNGSLVLVGLVSGCPCQLALDLPYPVAGSSELTGLGEGFAMVLAGASNLGAEAIDLVQCLGLEGFQTGEPVLQAEDEPSWICIGEILGGQAHFGLRHSIEGENDLCCTEHPASDRGHVEAAEVAGPGRASIRGWLLLATAMSSRSRNCMSRCPA
jgi:hypothetical protein